MQRTLGDAIRHFRTLAGLTQEQLAVKIATDQNTVSRLERNVSNPSVGRITQLVQALGISHSELFRYTEHDDRLHDPHGDYDPASLLREIAALPAHQQRLLLQLVRQFAR